MGGTMRAVGRLAAVFAAAMAVAGLLAGGAAAHERPEAQSANSEIEFCVSQGGEADAWVLSSGGIGVSCTFDDYTSFCQYFADNPGGACIILGALVADPGTTGTTGTRSPAITREPALAPDETRAA